MPQVRFLARMVGLTVLFRSGFLKVCIEDHLLWGRVALRERQPGVLREPIGSLGWLKLHLLGQGHCCVGHIGSVDALQRTSRLQLHRPHLELLSLSGREDPCLTEVVKGIDLQDCPFVGLDGPTERDLDAGAVFELKQSQTVLETHAGLLT